MGDNDRYFISPDANKSNSKINNGIKERISGLVKYTINNYFKGNTGRIQISDTLKHAAWECYYDGNERPECCRAVCTETDCRNDVTAWSYDLVKIYEDEGIVVENLRPICKSCSKKL